MPPPTSAMHPGGRRTGRDLILNRIERPPSKGIQAEGIRSLATGSGDCASHSGMARGRRHHQDGELDGGILGQTPTLERTDRSRPDCAVAGGFHKTHKRTSDRFMCSIQRFEHHPVRNGAVSVCS